MAGEKRGVLRRESPTWDGPPFFGAFGQLASDGERVQCHICGCWYHHLGAHVHHTHGMRADEYRAAFGLKQVTKRAGEAYRRKRRAIDTELLRRVGVGQQDRFRNASSEQKQQWSRSKVVRREHELHWTEPERMRAALVARWGTDRGRPKAFYKEVARAFLEELARGQRGVYRRLDERFGTNEGVSRARVLRAVDLGILEWIGEPHEPKAALAGSGGSPSDDFERGFGHLQGYVAAYGHARGPSHWRDADGFPTGSWVASQRQRYLRATLSGERIRRLEAQPGWMWRSPRGGLANVVEPQGDSR